MITIDKEVSEARATINDLPNEVLFNILERFQDDKSFLSNCLIVSKRWYDIALAQLWYNIEFGIYNRYQTRTLKQLFAIEPSSPNFRLVRNLELYIDLQAEMVTSSNRCQEIAETIKLYIELLRVCTGVRSLRISLHPFKDSDAHHSVWQELQVSNTIIVDLVHMASTREYSDFFLDISQPPYYFDEALSGIYQYYTQALGGQVTELHISESAALKWSWLAPLRRLRRLQFDNTGNPGEEPLARFWDTIAKLPLENLELSGITFPSGRRFKKWGKSLRMINLNRFTDIEGTCSSILQSFPNLDTLRLHNSHPLPSTRTNHVPIKRVACVNLRTAVFTQCRPQKNIISQIAKACPLLQVCMSPNNASDSDIITLIDSCQFLTTLSIDCCTNLTGASIHYVHRAERLRSFLFNFEHLNLLDEESIFALAENCPDLHNRGCRISTVGAKNERMQRIAVRSKLSGDARFKRWLLRNISWAVVGPYFRRFQIDIDSIRKERNEAGYYSNKSYHL